jgi:adenosylmethionine---8-amino-7-oxononanoate aminotransferase
MNHMQRSQAEIDELIALDRSVVWHAFSQMESYDGLIIQSAEGCWLTDIHGRRILDGASSLWCNLHGHRHPHIDRAIREQLDQVAHVTNLGMSHPTTIALAKRLVDLAFGGWGRPYRTVAPNCSGAIEDSCSTKGHVFFCGDGASAVEVAMKIAFQYWQQIGESRRTKFIALGSAYHGDTVGTVALGDVPRFHELFRPLLFPVLRGPCPDAGKGQAVTVHPHVNDDLCKEYLDAYRGILEAHRGEVVAVVVEPLLQCAAGMVLQPVGFLKGIAELCQEFETLLIVDEIAVGLGRTGKCFASEWEGVNPDLLCVGKGLTGGYLAMSATITSERVFQAFLGDESKTLYHGHTFGGNPLAAAAAHASLDLLDPYVGKNESPGRAIFLERIAQLEKWLKKIANHDDVASVRQIGLLGAIEFHGGRTRAREVCGKVLELGVWLRPLGGTIPLVPPLCISEEELTVLLNALEYGVDLTGKVL